nr:hypothetical protein [Candidatus Woesearchaeota archaeon]
MKIYKLKKIVLSIFQKDSKLLKDISSNTLDKEKNAFLDRYAKIIVTFDQLQINQDKALIIIDEIFHERLLNYLTPLLKLSKAILEKTDYNVYYDLDSSYKQKGEFIIKQKQGKLIITKNNLRVNVSEQEFTLFRVKNNIPFQGTDFDKEMVLNVSSDFISLTKGCFPGQEIVARVSNLAKPPRRLSQGSDKENLTSRVYDQETNKYIGFTFLVNSASNSI